MSNHAFLDVDTAGSPMSRDYTPDHTAIEHAHFASPTKSWQRKLEASPESDYAPPQPKRSNSMFGQNSVHKVSSARRGSWFGLYPSDHATSRRESKLENALRLTRSEIRSPVKKHNAYGSQLHAVSSVRRGSYFGLYPMESKEEKLATLAEKYAANEDHVVVTRRDSYLDPEFERKDAMDDYAVRKREAAIREERRLLRKENERVRRLSAWKERMEMARNVKESEHDRERRELAEAREEAEKERQLREQKANEEKRRKQEEREARLAEKRMERIARQERAKRDRMERARQYQAQVDAARHELDALRQERKSKYEKEQQLRQEMGQVLRGGVPESDAQHERRVARERSRDGRHNRAASTRDDIIRAAMENRLVPGSSQTTLDDDRGVRPDDWIVSAKSGNRGIVRYVGHTAFASGVWLGIELEAPAGKHDGLTGGKRYFRCPPRHGVFMRPRHVLVVGKDIPDDRTDPNLDGSGRMMGPGRQGMYAHGSDGSHPASDEDEIAGMSESAASSRRRSQRRDGDVQVREDGVTF